MCWAESIFPLFRRWESETARNSLLGSQREASDPPAAATRAPPASNVMSSRQLRKLQQQRELELQAQAAEKNDTSGDEEPEVQAPSKPKVSLFAALGGDDDDDDQDQDESEDEEPPPTKEVEPIPQPATSKKSKKKKKKKKASGPGVVSGATDQAIEDAEDEIEKAIKELNLDPRSDNVRLAKAQGTPSRGIDLLLHINSSHLKAINEMRQLFGREILDSAAASVDDDDAARAGAGNRRRRRGAGGGQGQDLESVIRSFSLGRKTLPELSLRRNPFIQGREHWPMATPGGLSMKLVEKRDVETEYTFVHDRDYDSAQAAFFSQVQVGDPTAMIYLLQALRKFFHSPRQRQAVKSRAQEHHLTHILSIAYHVSTTLQVANIARQQDDMALAAELCERALFTFGRVATSGFKQDLEQGRARLDFRRPENRQFWLAGFHYLRSLVRKGTFRTALEWAKVLFSLDDSDPYCMRHYIHSLAIRAHEATWYIQFLQELENSGDNRDTNYLRQSVVLAKLLLEDIEGAREAIADGIRRVPWLYCALFQELNLDAPPSIWGISSDAPSRTFWTKLYIYQMKDLWNNPQTIALLQAVAQSLDRVDTASLTADDPPVDLGATRLVYLEGQTSLMAAAPREYLNMQPNYDFDPLPPPKEDNIFSSTGVQLPFMAQAARDAQPTNEIEQLMRNLLQRRQARAAAVGGGAGAGAAGAGLGAGALGAGFDPDDDAAWDEEELAAQLADDEELERDLEEVRNQPGMLNALMRLLGGGASAGGFDAAQGDEDEQGGTSSEIQGDVPGAWPEDRDDHSDGRPS